MVNCDHGIVNPNSALLGLGQFLSREFFGQTFLMDGKAVPIGSAGFTVAWFLADGAKDKDGQTGFLVANVAEAVRAVGRISEVDRRACRSRVRQHFSIETMVEGYERVYSTIFDLEAKRRS